MLLGARDHLEGTLFSVLAWTLSHGGACAIIFDRPAHNGSWRSLVYFAEKILKNFRRLGACDITFDWSAHNCSRHTLCFFFGGGRFLRTFARPVPCFGFHGPQWLAADTFCVIFPGRVLRVFARGGFCHTNRFTVHVEHLCIFPGTVVRDCFWEVFPAEDGVCICVCSMCLVLNGPSSRVLGAEIFCLGGRCVACYSSDRSRARSSICCIDLPV